MVRGWGARWRLPEGRPGDENDESWPTHWKMKFPGDSDVLGLPVDSLMTNWSNGDHHHHHNHHQLLIEGGSQKLMLSSGGGGGNSVPDDDDDDSKSPLDEFDLLMSSSQPSEPNNNLAELKPLPPFTGYTGHLSINGISGHHYHTIASAPSPPRVETNNNSSEAANQNMYYTDQVVSSSTMDCSLDNIKSEVNVDYNNLLAPDIEDIAVLIGSAIAPNPQNSSNGEASRDSWIDALIDTACSQSSPANGKMSGENLQEFVTTSQFGVNSPPNVLYQQSKRDPSSYMPLLQSRLQNGPPKGELYSGLVTSDCPSPSSSTPYLAHSPPGHVVSTSDLVRYNPVHSSTRPSPELQVGYPHTTTPSKKSKSKTKSKSVPATSTVVYSEPSLGKEKPVHRCTICNRGFLNKSNIKVHMRTHTGEKPFRCEVCGKAFRQKAHLIKHAQIHKRIGRD
ncbi:zinc finger protein 530 isoform X1 [Cimex lectularius]|uniref:C2H2-type domain-containing protein n=2 Tax=Cimex lectularius TaxID=79782 RepID=A0A8I6SHU3_CIMLE|nr:zinc finger protein 530 isoform X1 [Cimex lectularius]